DFTFENVAKVSQAIANSLKKTNTQLPTIVIGYDNRFLSEKFALISGSVFSKNGFKVLIASSSVSSPNLCHFIKSKNSTGIMITASHNPPKFNGIKVKASYGGPVPDWINKEIENEIQKIGNVSHHINNFSTEFIDIKPSYIEYLKLSVDFSIIRKVKKIVLDGMHGCSGNYFDFLFDRENKQKIIKIREKRDPIFGGTNPEPIERNLSVLRKNVLAKKADIGLAFDGDADRLGVIDEKGKYLPPHIVFPLLLYYLTKYRGQSGKVLQTISLGYISKRIAEKYNLPFEETPVGFKYLTEKMLKENVLIAGEESGGYSVCGEIADRDGILSGFVLVEMIGYTKKKLSALVNELQREFGKTYFERIDIHISEIIYDKKEFSEKIASLIPDKINNIKVKEIKTFDGIKIIFKDDSWLLLRPSGTEPLIRIYSETPEKKQTEKMINFGIKILKERRLINER
ncbi:MAG: phosphoglucomutase/phosphomannomutase family protein, partial [Endomicrobiia bacterium]